MPESEKELCEGGLVERSHGWEDGAGLAERGCELGTEVLEVGAVVNEEGLTPVPGLLALDWPINGIHRARLYRLGDSIAGLEAAGSIGGSPCEFPVSLSLSSSLLLLLSLSSEPLFLSSSSRSM